MRKKIMLIGISLLAIVVTLSVLWYIPSNQSQFMVESTKNVAFEGVSVTSQEKRMADKAEVNGEVEQKRPRAPVSGQRKIIYRIQLSQDVSNVKDTLGEIEDIVNRANGYIQESNLWTERGNDQIRRRANITLRIPINKMEENLQSLKSLGVNRSESKSGQDVTIEFIDNEARINNLKIQEERLRELTKKASKVEELLKIETELTRIRTEIEQIESRQNYLSNMTDYATITMDLAEVKPVYLHQNETGIWNRAITGLKENVYNLMILAERLMVKAITYIPQLILLVLISLASYKFYKKRKEL